MKIDDRLSPIEGIENKIPNKKKKIEKFNLKGDFFCLLFLILFILNGMFDLLL